jgi:hypothetical protein
MDFEYVDLDELGIASLEMMAERGWLRVRAFGLMHTFAEGLPKRSNRRKRAIHDLLKSIDAGFMAVYQDEKGIFVGPANIYEIDPFTPSDCVVGRLQ